MMFLITLTEAPLNADTVVIVPDESFKLRMSLSLCIWPVVHCCCHVLQIKMQKKKDILRHSTKISANRLVRSMSKATLQSLSFHRLAFSITHFSEFMTQARGKKKEKEKVSHQNTLLQVRRAGNSFMAVILDGITHALSRGFSLPRLWSLHGSVQLLTYIAEVQSLAIVGFSLCSLS